MARIRTVKPDLFVNERVAACSVTAVVTYIGLFTQSDDHGRHRDNPAIIAGLLWPLRAEHTPVHVEEDLQQLADAGLICRYTGCDGKRYLHMNGWYEHQKIDRPSQSRLPVCVAHNSDKRCGPCKAGCVEVEAKTRGAVDEPSANPHRAVDPRPAQPARPHSDRATAPGTGDDRHPDTSGTASPTGGETTGQGQFVEASPNPLRNLDGASTSGSRIMDPGSSSPTGRTAPDGTVTAKNLLAEYVGICTERPPGDVLGHLGRLLKKLLAEGIDVDHIRAGLARYAEIQGHPSRLPSLVNDAMNARVPAQTASRPGVTHRAWINPVDPVSAYAEEL
ncbi:hypothetical protein HEP81_02029 [Streptomyces griseofuscus]|uniref:Phage or prophage related protein n=1 Tax=Streptomyces griseofuscus TaxID=146922 RepID=A0A7H1PWC6_9ACTN|nr:hypothetical protein [Streptomyces griseofuscus]QNT92356.1 hypothetical protein HEP81_02029 [Streptomyces griseofuscus]